MGRIGLRGKAKRKSIVVHAVLFFISIHNQTGVFSERFPHYCLGGRKTEQTNCFVGVGFYNYRSFHAITLGDLVYGLNI